MKAKSRKADETETESSGYKKWGRSLLLAAVILNGVVLTASIKLFDLQGELQELRYKEQLFFINDQTRKDELTKHSSFGAYSNVLAMLTRLLDERLTPEEKSTILSNANSLGQISANSQVNATTISYLQANDPPAGTDVGKLFGNLSDSEHASRRGQFEEQTFQYLTDIKIAMVHATDKITFWQYIHSILLVISSVSIIVGSILSFRGV